LAFLIYSNLDSLTAAFFLISDIIGTLFATLVL